MDGLVVPTRDAFRRFLVRRLCSNEPYRGAGLAESCLESLAEWKPGLPSPASLPRVSDPGSWPCVYEQLFVTFASPKFISTLEYSGQSEDCEPRGFRWHETGSVRRHGGTGSVSFSELLGEKAERAYAEAAFRAKRVWRSQQPASGFEDSGIDCDPEDEADDGWYVDRYDQLWRAMFKQQPGNAECIMQAPIEIRLPSAFIGFGEPIVPWAAVRRKYPTATDAHVSPDGRYWVVITPERTALVTPEGVEVARFPDGNIVQVQWALGRNVAVWQEALAKFDSPSVSESLKPGAR